MALFLEGLEGPAEGQKFRLAPGVRIGRSTGEILLADPKVSALHAQVESSEKGQLILIDKGSSNGLRINGMRVQRIAIMPGVRFQIGRSHFKVVELAAGEIPISEVIEEEGWRGVLRAQIPRLSATNPPLESRIQKFDPVIELTFLEGIQAQTKIILGYGPRKAGSDVLDIELQDPESPDIAFEILPEDNGTARIRTAYPHIVLVNDGHVSSDILRSGDQIRVGTTLIEVNF